MILETDRLFLLSPDSVDAGDVAEYVRRNRDFMREFEPERESAYYTAEFHREMLERQAQEWKEQKGYRFYIAPKDDRHLIMGFVGLSNVVMGAFCSCFIGCQLDKDHLRQGFMTEAVNEVVRYAFGSLGLHRIEGNIMPRNKASIGVALKCGFVNEGLSKKYLKINGVWEDHLHFVRLNEEME
ncbi:MAG: GNAT family N-acetyltransferase [Hungatella sp.]|jgi:ribosomal-protein-alanine N-acetyltransferase|nr:GNAT family N-acetyltransferase [Hungatella sp.]